MKNYTHFLNESDSFKDLIIDYFHFNEPEIYKITFDFIKNSRKIK